MESYKKVIDSYLEQYLLDNNVKIKKQGKMKILDVCFNTECTPPHISNIINNIFKIHCHKCNSDFKITDVVRIFEKDKSNLDDDKIYQYIKDKYDIKTVTPKDELGFDFYFKEYNRLNWDLLRLAKNEKGKPLEKEFQNKNHKNIDEWKDWVLNSNIALKTGSISNCTVVDIDAMDGAIKKKIYNNEATKEEITNAIKTRDEILTGVMKKLGKPENYTLVQKTFGGLHLFFEYDATIAQTVGIKIEGASVDVRNNGGYIVIYPSIVHGYKREFVGQFPEKLITIPTHIKELLVKNKQ